MGEGNVGKGYFYVSNTKQDQLQQQSIGIQVRTKLRARKV